MQPIFLVSLPRSGSTVVQRTLAAHPQVATAPEPWLLLPLAAMSGERSVRCYANFSHAGAVTALGDLVARMPGGAPAYEAALRDFVLQVYGLVSESKRKYFVDKTPRYFLIVDFLLRVFPEAKLVVLLRHPLDVLASIITTWGGSRLWLHNSQLDLHVGPQRIHEACAKHATRLTTVHYEQFVSSPEKVTRELCSWLGLPFDDAMLKDLPSEVLSGQMGDKSDNIRRPEVVGYSVGRWRTTLANPVRREYARRYLRTLGPQVLETFGVDMAALEREMDQLPMHRKHVVTDIAALAGSHVGMLLMGSVFRDRWRNRASIAMTKLD